MKIVETFLQTCRIQFLHEFSVNSVPSSVRRVNILIILVLSQSVSVELHVTAPLPCDKQQAKSSLNNIFVVLSSVFSIKKNLLIDALKTRAASQNGCDAGIHFCEIK